MTFLNQSKYTLRILITISILVIPAIFLTGIMDTQKIMATWCTLFVIAVSLCVRQTFVEREMDATDFVGLTESRFEDYNRDGKKMTAYFMLSAVPAITIGILMIGLLLFLMWTT